MTSTVDVESTATQVKTTARIIAFLFTRTPVLLSPKIVLYNLLFISLLTICSLASESGVKNSELSRQAKTPQVASIRS